jgi:hypothetical protein
VGGATTSTNEFYINGEQRVHKDTLYYLYAGVYKKSTDSGIDDTAPWAEDKWVAFPGAATDTDVGSLNTEHWVYLTLVTPTSGCFKVYVDGVQMSTYSSYPGVQTTCDGYGGYDFGDKTYSSVSLMGAETMTVIATSTSSRCTHKLWTLHRLIT